MLVGRHGVARRARCASREQCHDDRGRRGPFGGGHPACRTHLILESACASPVFSTTHASTALAVFAVALLVRIVYLVDIGATRSSAPRSSMPSSTTRWREQLAGPGLGRAPFQMPPLYPFCSRSCTGHRSEPDRGAHPADRCWRGCGSDDLPDRSPVWRNGRRARGRRLRRHHKSLLYLEAICSQRRYACSSIFSACGSSCVGGRMGHRATWSRRIGLRLSALALPLVLVTVPVFAIGWRRFGVAPPRQRSRALRRGTDRAGDPAQSPSQRRAGVRERQRRHQFLDGQQPRRPADVGDTSRP